MIAVTPNYVAIFKYRPNEGGVNYFLWHSIKFKFEISPYIESYLSFSFNGSNFIMPGAVIR